MLTEENIGRIRLVRASVRERDVIMRFRSEADSMVAAASRAVRLEAFCTPFLLQLPTAGLIAVLLYGSHRALGGGISIGESATFHIYVLLLVEPAGRIAYWMVSCRQRSGRRSRRRDPQIPARARAPPTAPA